MPKLYSCKFSGTNYRAVLVTAVLIGHRSGSLAPRTEFAPERENVRTPCRDAADFGSREGSTTQDVIPSPCNIMSRRGGFWVRRGFHYSGRYT